MTIFDVFDSGGGIYELPYVDEIKFKDKVLDFDIYLYNYIQENLCIIMGEAHEREIKGIHASRYVKNIQFLVKILTTLKE